MSNKTFGGNIIHPDTLSIMYVCDFDGVKLTPRGEKQFSDKGLALHYYAETPNPASQLIQGDTNKELIDNHQKFLDRIDHPEFIKMLNATI